ncbi:hypothetical protein CHUAL_002898 [Chamberlinius hualienensis]
MGELVNIVWPLHMKAVCDGLWSLFKKSYKTDFVLSLNDAGNSLMVHHLMLAIFCPSIRNCDDNRFAMKLDNLNIDDEDLKVATYLMIEFMYRGCIKVHREKLPILQSLAEVLGFRVLARVIQKFNKQSVDQPAPEDEEILTACNSPVGNKQVKVVCSENCENQNLSQNTDELYLTFEGLVEADESSHPEDVEPEINDDVSDWEAEQVKVKRSSKVKSSRTRSKKSSRVRLAAARNSGGNFVKYNVDKYYDPDREGLVCKICDKVLKYKSTYVRHIRCHENPELYSRCTYCSYKSDTKNALIQHLAAKHKVDLEGNKLEKNIKCSECEYTCVLDFQLKNHVYVKHSTRGHVCNLCGYSCKSRAVYDVHLQAVHGNNERPSKTLGVLRNHLKTHGDKKTCDICGVWLTYHSYKAHMKLHTTNERPFPCHLCNFAARKKYNLKVHLKNVHKLEDLSGCQQLEEEQSVEVEKETVTAVMISEEGEQLIEISEHGVLDTEFHMDVS